MTQYANKEETWQETSSPVVLFWPDDWRSRSLTFELGVYEGIFPITAHLASHTIELPETLVLSAVNLCTLADETIKDWEITQQDIPSGEPYKVIKPIPVKIVREHETDFTATFEAGNISIGGETFQDAFQSLVLEILDTLDTLLDCNASLGRDAALQLRTLSGYIGKTDNATR
jgi:hypothetical protein